ncbi:MAG: DUF3108 domain-containing protein [Gammaproteobacteria bacterium]|nr:DUF3108 domain-containing protein [Gammaproteobacteria bacterium]
MNFRIALSVIVLLLVPVALADVLPEKLELEYGLTRSGIGVGDVSRTLQRRADGSYVHTMWTRPTGLARLLTQTEWHEEGEFIVQGTDVLPQRFSETRTGDKRAYEHRLLFDREKSLLLFGNARSQPLPRDIQDQGSVIYALMLNPLVHAGERILPTTDGKDVEMYHFIYQGKESLPTLFGTRETVILRRVSQKQFEREQRCRTQTKPDADCKEPDDFTLWLLPEKCYVPVKLERRRKDETTTMTLREARGL